VLVNRIVHLIQEESIDPRNILAVTFTKKAAREMKHRLVKLLGVERSAEIQCTTLHSFCALALRKYSPKGLRSFSIYDDQDAKRLIRDILTEAGDDPDLHSPSKVKEAISVMKREGLTVLGDKASVVVKASPGEGVLFGVNRYDDEEDDTDTVTRLGIGGGNNNPLYKLAQDVLREYTTALRINNAKDFDDLVVDTYRLLRGQSIESLYLRRRYKHVLCDEWQDVDKIQYALLKELVLGDNEAENKDLKSTSIICLNNLTSS
jgi:DNA helicase-2/ATP-dependent DNA helicase PcrA